MGRLFSTIPFLSPKKNNSEAPVDKFFNKNILRQLKVLAIILMIASFVFQNVSAATYTFTQSSWTGGASSTATIVHNPDANRNTSGTTYSSSTSNISTGTSLTLLTSSNSATQAYSNGSGDTPNAGGFNAGTTKTNVVTSGDKIVLGTTASTPTDAGVVTSYNTGAYSPQGYDYGAVFDSANNVLWVAMSIGSGPSTQTVAKVNPQTGAILSAIVIPDNAILGLVYDSGNHLLWATGYGGLYKIDPSAGTVLNTYSLPGATSQGGLVYDSTNGVLWLTYANSYIAKIGTSGGNSGVLLNAYTVTTSSNVGAAVYDSADNAIWIQTNNSSHSIYEVSAVDGHVIRDMGFISSVFGLAYDQNGSIWASAGTFPVYLTPINGSNGSRPANYSFVSCSGSYSSLAYDSANNAIWATNSCNYQLSKFAISNGTRTDYDLTPTNLGSTAYKPIVFDSNSNSIWYFANSSSTLPRIYTRKYLSSGTFVSAAINLGKKVNLSTLSFNASIPANTGLTIDVRASDDGSTWGSWQTGVASGGSISGLGYHQYVQYRVNLSTTNVFATPQFNSITINYTSYNSTQYANYLISSPFDSGSDANIFSSLRWSATTPANTSIVFQARTASTSAGLSSASWAGPDGSGSSYFTVAAGTSATASQYATSSRWFQYKVFFNTDGSGSPTLSIATSTYVVNAPPQFDSTYGTGGISVYQSTSTDANAGKAIISYKVKDIDSDSDNVIGRFAVQPYFEYSTNNGSSWQAISTSTLNSSDYGIQTVATSTYSTLNATWNVTSQLPNQRLDTVKVRISVNDEEAANNNATSTSASFSIDTTPPADTAIINVASSTVTITASDYNNLLYKISSSSDTLGSVSWTAVNATSMNTAVPITWALNLAHPAIAVSIKDVYGNTLNTNPVAPVAPQNLLLNDVSNPLQGGTYGEFLSWDPYVATTSAAFGSAKVYRSTDGTNYSLLSTITSSTQNFYYDNNLSSLTTYYYYVTHIDSNGDISTSSRTVYDQPNGVNGAGAGSGISSPTAAAVQNVNAVNNGDKTVSVSYTLTDTSISNKTSVSYEGYVFYNSGITVSTSTDSTITVSDASKMFSSGYIQIGSEVIKYASKNGNVLSGLTRGTWPTDLSVGRVSRQNTYMYSGTPVWILATSTGSTIINNTIATGQNGTINWNLLNESSLAGASYSNFGLRVLVNDNQTASSGPVSSQNDQSTDGVLPTFDLVVPTISSFTLPSVSASETVSISSFSANDNIGVTGYLVTESTSTPTATSVGWVAVAPTSYTFSTEGNKTLYAWVKDAFGNVSVSSSASVIVSLTVPSIGFNSTSSNGLESVSSVSIPVSLTSAPVQDITATISVLSSSTAVSGIDYNLSTTTVTIPAGSTSTNFTLNVINDAKYGPDRTVILNIASANGALIGSTSTYTYTINEADSLPTIGFSTSTGSGAENITPVNIPVNISEASRQDITVNYQVSTSSTAVYGVNYSLATSGVVTISAGLTSANISLGVLTSGLIESNKNVVITLSNPSGATSGTTTSFTYTIVKINQPSSVSPVINNVVATQSSASQASVSYTLTDASYSSKVSPSYEGYIFYDNGITVSTSTDSTITVSDASKMFSSGYIQIGSEVIKYASKNGNVLSGLTRGTWPTNGTSRTSKQVSAISIGSPVWIKATSTSPVSITNSSISSGQSGTIAWNILNETSLAGNTYSNLGIRVLVNDNQTASFNPLSSQSDQSADGRLSSFDLSQPTIQFAQTTSNGSESAGPVNLSVALSKVYPLDVSVNYAISSSSTAVNGVDYNLNLSGTVTIPSGSTSTNIVLTPIHDFVSGVDKTVVINISGPSNATLGGNTTLTHTINESDVLPSVGFNSTSSSGLETVSSVSIPVSLSAVSSQDVTAVVAVLASSTAVNGVDYNLSTTTVTIPAGSTSTNFTLNVVHDSQFGVNKNVVLSLSTSTGATLGTSTQYVYTIIETDNLPVVGFATSTGSGAENSSTTNIVVALDKVSGADVTVNISADPSSTAVSGEDYTLTTTTITIPAGSTSTTVPVNVVHNPTYSSDKNLVLVLSSPSGATLSATTTFTYTITEVDNVAPEFDPTFAASGISVIQNTTSSDPDFGKIIIEYKVRDGNTDSDTGSVGTVTPSFEYNLGSGWYRIATSTLGATDLNPKSVSTSTYTLHSATWDAKTQLGNNISNSSVQIRLTVSDLQPLSPTRNITSALFTIDTRAPQVSQFHINLTNNTLYLIASDLGNISYEFSNNADLSADGVNQNSGQWLSGTNSVNTSVSWTVSASSTYPVIYLGVKDEYGNIATTSITAPYKPSGIAYHDTSNVRDGVYKEMISWSSYVPTSTSQFSSYVIYRSTDGGVVYTPVATTTNVDTNYYIDNGLSSSTSYSYKVVVIDTSGNTSPFSDVVTDTPDGIGLTDTTPPVISNIVASAQSDKATITWTTDEISNSIVEFSTDNSYSSSSQVDTLATSHTISLNNLSQNTTYYYRVTSVDAANNTSTVSVNASTSQSLSFTTTGGPVISAVQATNIDYKTATISWTTNKDSDSYVVYSSSANFNGYKTAGTSALIGGSGPTYTHSVSLSGLDSGTTYYYYVKSTDGNGNTTIENNSSAYYQFQTAVDNYPPEFSNVSVPVSTGQSAVIFWQTDKLADSQLSYGTSADALTTTVPIDLTMTIYHSMSIAGLSPETTYYFKVRSRGSNAVLGYSTTTSFTTPKDGEVVVVSLGGTNLTPTNSETKDTTPPVISNVSVASTTAFATVISFDTNEPTRAFINYGKDTSYGDTASDPTLATHHDVRISGLTMGTEYHYQVQAVDKSSNSASEADATFKTKYFAEALQDLKTVENVQQFQQEVEDSIQSILPSLLPPFIEKPQVTDITENSASVFWRTNTKAYGIVSYASEDEYNKNADKPYTQEVSNTTDKVNEHTIVITGLKSNTKYHFLVKSFSLPQVVGSSTDMTFITQAAKVQANIVEVKNSSFKVVWNTDIPASTIVEYKNLSNGTINRSIDDNKKTYHEMTVENLTPATTYEISVSGYTADGNLIPGGNAMSITTSKDVTPPKISGFKVDNALVPGNNNKLQTVISWITDEPANSRVFYQEGSSQGKDFANKVEIADTYSTNHAVIVTNMKPGTLYQIKITSTDQSGNTATFGPRTIITPRQTESIMDVIFKNFEDTFKFMRNVGK